VIAVAFEDTFTQTVKLAVKSGSAAWETSQFEAGSFAPTVAMDSLGGIHLAYVRPPAPGVSNLVYARRTAAGSGNCGTGNSYNCEAVTYAGLGGCAGETSNPMPSLVTGANHTPRLAVKDCVAVLLLSRAGGNWQKAPGEPEQSCPAVSGQLQLKMKSDGWYYAFGTYFTDSGSAFWCVGKTDGVWYTQPPDLAIGAGGTFSVAVDPLDLPQICYTDGSPTAGSTLRYASRGQLDWNISTVYTSYASDCSIALRTDGKPGISFYDGYATGLYYAEGVGNLWNKEAVDTAGNVGSVSSVVFDNQNRPMIAYVDRTNWRIKLARRF